MSKQTALAALTQRAIKAMDDDVPGYNPGTEKLVKDWQRWAGLLPDGWPGTNTLRALWQHHRPTREEVVAAALAAMLPAAPARKMRRDSGMAFPPAGGFSA